VSTLIGLAHNAGMQTAKVREIRRMAASVRKSNAPFLQIFHQSKHKNQSDETIDVHSSALKLWNLCKMEKWKIKVKGSQVNDRVKRILPFFLPPVVP
jgi:hypothetical protein